MKQKSPKFFKRVKDSVFNFDEYKTFAEEKLSFSIVYLLKIIFIFATIVTICIAFKLANEVNILKKLIEEQCPDFIFEDNNFIILEDNKQFIIEDNDINFGIILDSEKQDLKEIPKANDYQNLIAILKDKVIFKSINGIENTVSYKTLNEQIELNNLNKQTIIEILFNRVTIIGYVIFVIVLVVLLFIAFSIQIIIDVLMLSLIGFLLSRIVGVAIKYRQIFNIAAYSLTLSIILYLIYIVINLFTGFNIVYFDIAYRAISYIYIITAILIIKSDLTKQNMELTKIIQVQKEVREEKQEEKKENPEEEEKEDKEKSKKDKEEKEKEENNQEPEGNQA